MIKSGTYNVEITTTLDDQFTVEMHSTMLSIPNEPNTDKLGSRTYMDNDDGTIPLEYTRALYDAINTIIGLLDDS